MENMANNLKLIPKFELLNPNFDGYKLYSDSNQSVYCRTIENGIAQSNVSDATCYLYTRMESLHNHLFSDPFEVYSIYVFNSKGHLLMYSFHDNYVASPHVVWQEDLEQMEAQDSSDISNLPFSSSVSFPSSSLAITSNGLGALNILQTGDRNGGESWVNLMEVKIVPGNIVHSLLIDNDNEAKFKQELHIIILSITTPAVLKANPLHTIDNDQLSPSKTSPMHIVYWLSFGFDGGKWQLIRERRIVGSKSLEYIALEPTANGLVLLSHDNYFYVYDSCEPIKDSKKEEKQNDQNENNKYVFMQTNEEIKLWINVGPNISKDELSISIDALTIKIKIKDAAVLEETFLHSTDSFASTWILDGGKLEICIPKAKENIQWASLFEGGNRQGEELLDMALVEEVHQRLAHLTSDQWNPDPDIDRPAFNPGQLEACDDAAEDLLLTILDGTTHLTSHKAHLGAVQHLFNVKLEKSLIPSFCLRHDVDGLLWEVNEDRSFNHVSTFNAFGYVRASKTMAKFTRGSPDNSYVAVADVDSHVYVFCQPESLGGELRHRKTGKISTTISRQLIISLKNHDQVMGLHCAPNAIFVLTDKELFVYAFKGVP